MAYTHWISGDGGYEYAFDKVIVPAIEKYNPDLIVVASGE
jgi:acetoin utilization deacetylase AcuC-like enzyme